MGRNILEYEWQWNEALNPTPFKLGRPIQEVLPLLTLIKQEADASEYEGINGCPWHVNARQGVISAVYFRTEFFELLTADLWDREAVAFVTEVDQHLPRYPGNGGGDQFRVVFRGGFVAIAGFSQP